MLKDCKYFEGTGNFCSRVTDMRCDEFPECEFKYIKALKAENEILKSQLDFEVQKKEVFEIENERLKSCLQEIKAIAENQDLYRGRQAIATKILDLITKAESEE